MLERFGRRAGEMVLVSGVGAALTLAALLVGLRARGDRPITSLLGDPSWQARAPGWLLAEGLEPPEITPDGAVFLWTGPRAALHVPALSRSVPYQLVLRARAPRPSGTTAPIATLSADGAMLRRLEVSGEARDLALELPVARGEGVDVVVEVSDVLHRGTPVRPRDLGIALERVSLQPLAPTFPLCASVLVQAALATAAWGPAAVLCGLTRAASLAAVFFVSGAHAWLLLRQSALLRGYAGSLMCLGAVMAMAAIFFGYARHRRQESGSGWSIAAFLALGLALLKLALFLHPTALVGDALFQANRAARVVNGELFFTSVTPKPAFEFPYAIALYVVAAPFWRLVNDHVLLLRAVTLAADAGAALAVYAFARTAWRETGTALAASALYALVPIGLDTFCTGNLTNDFGQAVFILGLTTLATAACLHERVATPPFGMLAAAVLLIAMAFLSHFSTFAVGLGVGAAVTAVLFVTHRPRAARAVAGVFLAAAAISYGLYYSHFHETYRQTLGRVRAGEGRQLERSIASPPGEKLPELGAGVRGSYGDALILSAVAGGVFLWRRRERGTLALCLCGWTLGIGVFILLGILTPVQMRSLLAGQAVVAILGGVGLAWAWAARRILRPLVLLAWAVVSLQFLRLAASVPG